MAKIGWNGESKEKVWRNSLPDTKYIIMLSIRKSRKRMIGHTPESKPRRYDNLMDSYHRSGSRASSFCGNGNKLSYLNL